MATYVHDCALCLRVNDFSETSQTAMLFTREHGMVPMIAKGIKRPNTRNQTGRVTAPLDLLTSGTVVYVPARATAELSTLAEWELTDPRTALRRQLGGLYAGMACVEFTQALLGPHDPHVELYDELMAALDLLTGPQRLRALVAYAKAALTQAGYQPQLDVCGGCGRTPGLDEPVWFSPIAGGLVCRSCPAAGRSLATTGRLAAALHRLPTPRQLQAAPPERPADVQALHAALELLLAQMEGLTDKPLKTHGLLATIFAWPPSRPVASQKT